MTTTLYKIETEYLSLLNQVEEAEGEITEEVDQALTINKAQLQTKTLAYIDFIDNTNSFIDRIDKEIKRLQSIKKTKQNLVNRLEGKLVEAVTVFGEITAQNYTVKNRESQAVIITDLTKLPKEYTTTKVEIVADKTAIKKALAEGKEIPGAYIEVRQNLNIK